jgi:hypothetical protein
LDVLDFKIQQDEARAAALGATVEKKAGAAFGLQEKNHGPQSRPPPRFPKSTA